MSVISVWALISVCLFVTFVISVIVVNSRIFSDFYHFRELCDFRGFCDFRDFHDFYNFCGFYFFCQFFLWFIDICDFYEFLWFSSVVSVIFAISNKAISNWMTFDLLHDKESLESTWPSNVFWGSLLRLTSSWLLCASSLGRERRRKSHFRVLSRARRANRANRKFFILGVKIGTCAPAWFEKSKNTIDFWRFLDAFFIWPVKIGTCASKRPSARPSVRPSALRPSVRPPSARPSARPPGRGRPNLYT